HTRSDRDWSSDVCSSDLYHREDFARLRLAQPFDLVEAKATWLAALTAAESFAGERPPEEAGVLYYSRQREGFVIPNAEPGLSARSEERRVGKGWGCGVQR